jgi:hypothetical protein
VTRASDDAPGSCRPSNRERDRPEDTGRRCASFRRSARGVGTARRRVGACSGAGFVPSVRVKFVNARSRPAARARAAPRRATSHERASAVSGPRRSTARRANSGWASRRRLNFGLRRRLASREGASRNARPRRRQTIQLGCPDGVVGLQHTRRHVPDRAFIVAASWRSTSPAAKPPVR